MLEGDFGVVDLSVSCFTAKLPDEFAQLCDPGGTNWVTLGLESTTRVDRQLIIETGRAASDELAAVALLAEPEILHV